MNSKSSNMAIIMYGILILSAVLSFIYIAKQTDYLSKDLYNSQNYRFQMLQKADRLRHSSDDLTHFARTYVVTNNLEFKTRYFNTLKIRDGKIKRPLNYDGLYWDLEADIRVKRHPDTFKISLAKEMSQLPYTDKEHALLESSKKNSDSLVGMEVEAFNAMMGVYKDKNGKYKLKGKKNQKYAIKLLHSKDYYLAKSEIMKPIDSFISLLEMRTKEYVVSIDTQLKFYRSLNILIFLIFVIGNIFIYFYLNKQNKLLVSKDAQLLEQSRLAQMGEMISMIAHQWRQPLAAIASIMANMQIKQELTSFDLDTKDGQKELNDFYSKKTQDVNVLIRNLTTTIDDFRNFYKPSKKSIGTDIDEIIIKSLNIIKYSLSNDGIIVELNINSTNNIPVYTNEMSQVLLNILKNAQDNFKEKSINNPTLSISSADVNNSLILSICDNGGGIKNNILTKIFDPYFSTKSNKNGTGLGLYMSKTIIEKHHGGSLSVKNTKDGVCFTMKIPINKKLNKGINEAI